MAVSLQLDVDDGGAVRGSYNESETGSSAISGTCKDGVLEGSWEHPAGNVGTLSFRIAGGEFKGAVRCEAWSKSLIGINVVGTSWTCCWVHDVDDTAAWEHLSAAAAVAAEGGTPTLAARGAETGAKLQNTLPVPAMAAAEPVAGAGGGTKSVAGAASAAAAEEAAAAAAATAAAAPSAAAAPPPPPAAAAAAATAAAAASLAAAAAPTSSALATNGEGPALSLAAILQTVVDDKAAGKATLDGKRLETYLSPEDFKATFSVAYEDFLIIPKWKQANMRKQRGLF
jgi:hypothetical protein